MGNRVNRKNPKGNKKRILNSKQKRDTYVLAFSIICFMVFALSIIPMYATRTELDSTSKIYGVIFWISLIGGAISQFALWLSYKRWMRIYRIRRKKRRNPGIITFFSNKYAKVADISFVIVAFITILAFTTDYELWCYIMLSLLIFAFSMHCILNGKTYYHVLKQDKILIKLLRKKQREEQKKDESI